MLRRISTIITALFAIVLFTSCVNNNSDGSPVTGTITGTISQVHSTEPTTEAAKESYNWNENLAYESDDPMAFCNLFPDPYVATNVAGVFRKKATDTTTFDELASYTGEMHFSPGLHKDLTGIGYLTGITELVTYKNDVESLPPEIGNCKMLRKINIGKAYNLTTVSPEIGQLQELEEFIAFLTPISGLPDEIGNCGSLSVIQINACDNLASLPETIGNLQNLTYLDAHSCNLYSVPDSICNLKKLKFLDLGYNHLTNLPKRIGDLEALEYFKLFGNDLKTLPKSIYDLKKLEYLNVYDNFNLDEKYKKHFSKEIWECK